MMTQVRYDGTFDGFLTAIFEIYERNLRGCAISRSDANQGIFNNATIAVVTDRTKAERVWLGLRKKLSPMRCHEVYQSFLSELPQLEQMLLDFIVHVFSSKGNVESDFGHPCVLAISQLAHKVHREKHRMEAFVRFQLTKEGVYFASIHPDFNVLPLIVRHFKERYADQDWLIYDNKRKYGVHYHLKTLTVSEVALDLLPEASGEFLPSHLCHEEEIEYQKLWKGYFKSVNIGSRKNEKLHVRHVPTRYWKYLTEKRDL